MGLDGTPRRGELTQHPAQTRASPHLPVLTVTRAVCWGCSSAAWACPPAYDSLPEPRVPSPQWAAVPGSPSEPSPSWTVILPELGAGNWWLDATSFLPRFVCVNLGLTDYCVVCIKILISGFP